MKTRRAFSATVLLLGLGLSPSLRAADLDEVRLRNQNKGHAGIYYRLSERETGANLDNPLLDAVVIGVHWADVEPRRGQFDFGPLRAEVDRWARAGKGVVLSLTLYGQEKDDSRTPSWIYGAGAVPISFAGGGRAKGAPIRIPKVWDDSFVHTFVDPLVTAFARELDGRPGVWYVMPGFGHIGNLNAQPAKAGGAALQAAGWTPEKWRHYCQEVTRVYQAHFQKTGLLVKGALKLLRDRREGFYKNDADQLLADLGRAGVSVISMGAGPSVSEMQEVQTRLSPLNDLAKRGAVRLGIGDDWPLWVPEERRSRGPTAGHDDETLRRILDMSLSGTPTSPAAPITILFCQEPEITASNPKAPGYRPAVSQAMKDARQKLKDRDAQIFGR